MSTALDDGFGGFLVLLLTGVLAHEPWRWLGLMLGRNLSEDSEFFIWIRAVAAALVAGLVMRLIFFPIGVLTSVSLPIRLIAVAAGTAAFFALRRRLGIGILIGSLTLLAGALATGTRF